jgi:hypothetical protein
MKTKVIAFRLTETEHELLEFRATSNGVKVSDVIRAALSHDIWAAAQDQEKARKRAAAKAKREAKKAAEQQVTDAPA